MGINLEFVATLAEVRSSLPPNATVMEFGAQDISADPAATAKMVADLGFGKAPSIVTATELYKQMGFASYDAIDVNGGAGLLMSLNDVRHPSHIRLESDDSLKTTIGLPARQRWFNNPANVGYQSVVLTD